MKLIMMWLITVFVLESNLWDNAYKIYKMNAYKSQNSIRHKLQGISYVM